MTQENVGVGLEGFLDGSVPTGGLLPRQRGDRLPVGIDERDDFLVLAEQVARVAVLHCLPLQVGDGRNAHLRQRCRNPSVHFQPRRTAELARENVIHGEREQLSHLVADARLVEELPAVRARHLDDVQISVFAAKNGKNANQ